MRKQWHELKGERLFFYAAIFWLVLFCGSVAAQPFSFAITSDQRNYAGPGQYDNSSYYRGAIEALGSVGAGAFMIVIGDMDPVQSTEYTIEAVLGPEYIWYPVVGNHELPGQGTEEYYGANMDYVRAMNANGNTLPYIVNTGPAGAVETNYSFDYGNCHFVVLNEYFNGTSDVGTDGDVVTALYNWLAADLAATTKQHIFILGHEPAYPQPDVDTGRIRHEFDSLNQYPENRDRFWQLMVDEGVIAYICGHTHDYSLYNHNGVWHVESGHTYGLGDPEAPSTFMKFMIDGDEVTYATYRDDMAGGPYTLRYTGSLTSPEEQVTIVPTGSVWSYLDDGSDQGTAWSEINFDDSAWASGTAQLGYGDDGETTVVGYGPDANNKYITTYFRHTFDVQDANAYTSLNLRLLRDDGAVVYINGNEIYRTNLPEGTVDYQTFSTYIVSDPEEDQFFSTMLNPSLLVNGTNVLAVEVHQCNLTSSDISFDLSLTGATGGTPITSVYGQLYLDYNQNGVRDADDEGLARINVMVTDSRGSQTLITNPNGDWSAFVAPGTVTVDIDESDADFPVDAIQTAGQDPTMITAFEGDNTYAGADGYYIQISEMILVAKGSVWAFLDDGADGGTAWNDVSFNDASWSTGAAQLGYGDGDEVTVVSYGSDPKKKYITTYFRHAFNVPDASLITKLNLGLLRDDGAIVYLNGYEVFRSNMPVDPITYKTTASTVVEGADENQFLTTTIAPNRLTTGTNVLAVEIHQYFKMDEDISFDLELIAQQSGEPASYVMGHLYLDANGNGIQDGGEAGLANIDIIITDVDKTQTVSTNGDGDWTAMVAAGSVTIDVDQSDADFPADAAQTEGDDPTTVVAIKGETTNGGTDGYHVSLGGAIGDLVWNDSNHNGLQDQGEAGVEGVTVTLYNASGQVGSPQTTDNNGIYEFIGLDAGEYHLQFSNIPAGAIFTLQDVNDNNSDAQDSDADGLGATAAFLLGEDEIKTDLDAGIYIEAPPEPAQASGLIWNDANADGIKDAREKGVASVTINLLTASGNAVATAIADRKGNYSFADITPGTFIIEFVNPNPGALAFTLKDQGSNDAVDSDVNSDGRTDVLTFVSGEVKTNIDAGLADGANMQSENTMMLAKVPDEYDLLQNYPNPFNPETHIIFMLKEDGDVFLAIYNVQGQIVKILADGFHAAGVYTVVWKGTNEQDHPLSSGTYLYKLKVNDFTATRKMAFMR